MPFLAPLLLAGSSAVALPPPVRERGVAVAAEATSFTAAVWLSLVLAQGAHAPEACRWCAANPLDDAARGARWSRPAVANTLSNVLLGVTPAWSLGSLAAVGPRDGWRGEHWTNGLIVLESVFTAMLVNQVVKLEVGRARPDVHNCCAARCGAGLRCAQKSFEDNLSFFSGHATWSFAYAAASGTVASLRGYRGAPLVWGGGLAFAAATGYLRMAADRHYLTDVLTGAVVGTLVGALLPRAHLIEGSSGSAPAAPAASPAATQPWITVGGAF